MTIEHEIARLPLDPDLPPDFDSTPNEDRPTSQLDQWWDKPYLVTNGDGTFSCRCLNGGAWDRSSFLAAGLTREEAAANGLAVQATWEQSRRIPLTQYVDGETWHLVIAAQRPDQEVTRIASHLTQEEIQAKIGAFGVGS